MYLAKAGAVKRIGRGVLQITDRGQELLRDNPNGITTQTLQQYPEFGTFKNTGEQPTDLAVNVEDIGTNQTPEEQLDASYQIIRESLATELLDSMKKSSPAFFEKLVVELLVAMGYGGSVEDAGKAIGRTGDEGIDGIIKEDKLGLDNLYVQAKKWTGNVGRPAVQAFAGSLEGHRARKGVLITTSDFSADARGRCDNRTNLHGKEDRPRLLRGSITVSPKKCIVALI